MLGSANVPVPFCIPMTSGPHIPAASSSCPFGGQDSLQGAGGCFPGWMGRQEGSTEGFKLLAPADVHTPLEALGSNVLYRGAELKSLCTPRALSLLPSQG